jgi:hypothetical protein
MSLPQSTKMQRSRLFELTAAAGRADWTDTVSATRLAAAVSALSDELTNHAEHEDRLIHPLLRGKIPELAAALDAAHVELDGRLVDLEEPARAKLFRRSRETAATTNCSES